MDESAVGGTKIQRKAPSNAAQQAQAAMQQQQMMAPPQMQQQTEPTYYTPPAASSSVGPGWTASLRDTFSVGIPDEIKYAVIATLLFIVFNSKIVWKQLLKVPIMGGVEPSIIALGTNGLLFAIIFYIIIKYLK
jgi:hypothetical protein